VTRIKLMLGVDLLAPMLIEEERDPFDDPGWLFEISTTATGSWRAPARRPG